MSKKSKQTTYRLAEAGIIAALYVALTLLSSLFGLSSGIIQLRLSEALCVFCLFTPSAVWGLFVGCVLANVLTGCLPWDIVFGSLATLLGAAGGRAIAVLSFRMKDGGHKKAAAIYRYLVPLPTVLANALIIPLILTWAYSVPDGYGYLVLTVGVGELLSAYGLGVPLYLGLSRVPFLKSRH